MGQWCVVVFVACVWCGVYSMWNGMCSEWCVVWVPRLAFLCAVVSGAHNSTTAPRTASRGTGACGGVMSVRLTVFLMYSIVILAHAGVQWYSFFTTEVLRTQRTNKERFTAETPRTLRKKKMDSHLRGNDGGVGAGGVGRRLLHKARLYRGGQVVVPGTCLPHAYFLVPSA